MLTIRSTPPETVTTSIQREISAIDAGQPGSNVRTMEDAIAGAVPRFDATLSVSLPASR